MAISNEWADVVTITDAQFAARDLPVGRHRLSVTWRHGQRSVGRGRVGEVDLFATDGCFLCNLSYLNCLMQRH